MTVLATGARAFFRRMPGYAVAALTVWLATVSPVAKASRCATPRACTTAEVTAWLTELSNWGRWGAGDQLGAANLITPQKRREAARLVREGVSLSMSRDVTENVPPASGSYLIRTVLQMNP